MSDISSLHTRKLGSEGGHDLEESLTAGLKFETKLSPTNTQGLSNPAGGPGGQLDTTEGEGAAASRGNWLVEELEPWEPAPTTHTADWQPSCELCSLQVFIFSDAPDSFCGMIAGWKTATFKGLVKTLQVGGLSSSLGRVVSRYLEMFLYKPRCLSSWGGQPELGQRPGRRRRGTPGERRL